MDEAAVLRDTVEVCVEDTFLLDEAADDCETAFFVDDADERVEAVVLDPDDV